jgi:phosphoenolpyruvate carboxykinase (ATP)
MQNSELMRSTTKLDLSKAHFNLKTAQLYEFALSKDEAKLSDKGALVASTGQHTGRAANDKFIVEDVATKNTVGWGDINRPVSEVAFLRLREQVIKHLGSQELFVQDCIAGADPKNCVYVRVVTETAFHSLFIRNMLSVVNTNSARLSYGDEIIEQYTPEYTVYHAPCFKADLLQEKELHSDTFIIVIVFIGISIG